jgi:hypothetical protein
MSFQTNRSCSKITTSWSRLRVLEQVRLNMRDEYSKATRARIEGLVAFRLDDDLDEANPYLAVMSQRSFIEVVMIPLQVFAP